jgi:nitrate reductase gamma subunit
MDTAALVILGTYAIFGIAIFITLIVLIIRRIKKQDGETFEKRDN